MYPSLRVLNAGSSLMLRLVDWPSIGKQEEGEDVLPHERKVLTD